MATRHLRSAAFLSAVAVAAVSGCGVFTEPLCTAELRPGIELVVLDIVTNASPVVPPTITVTDGAHVERYPAAGAAGVVQPQYNFAHERPGSYSIVVEVPGFLTWTQSNFVVTGGECHVSTLRVTARLQR